MYLLCVRTSYTLLASQFASYKNSTPFCKATMHKAIAECIFLKLYARKPWYRMSAYHDARKPCRIWLYRRKSLSILNCNCLLNFQAVRSYERTSLSLALTYDYYFYYILLLPLLHTTHTTLLSKTGKTTRYQTAIKKICKVGASFLHSFAGCSCEVSKTHLSEPCYCVTNCAPAI